MENAICKVLGLLFIPVAAWLRERMGVGRKEATAGGAERVNQRTCGLASIHSTTTNDIYGFFLAYAYDQKNTGGQGFGGICSVFDNWSPAVCWEKIQHRDKKNKNVGKKTKNKHG